MTHNGHGLDHFHQRKRISKKLEPYPHPEKWKNFLDKSIYFVAITGPIMTIPQLSKIWIEQSAAGVSMITWIAYLVTAIFWLLYGIVHKEKPIIITNTLWIVLDSAVIVGTYIYG